MGLVDFLRPAKKVPSTWWSSKDPMNMRPRLSTLTILVIGEFLFGLGDAILIAAEEGNTPWTVLAEGLANVFGGSIGQATFIVSVAVLFLWIPIKETPGIGTVLNAIIIAATIEVMVPLIPPPGSDLVALLQVLLGILLIGIGSAMYLTTNLGPGPRDGWMTGLQRVTGVPIGRVRVTIEVSVLLVGVGLGGTFGFGTVLFAFAIGSVVASCLAVAGRIGST
ncbi:MAG TPA: hypothetical protein EYQ11_05460 [Candidatus Poseidoniales archaeon]|jgi:uncharacterized membrane protein YczE|nr:MAG: hypothetical protein CXT66_06685 [Euryarchaeota archaeon]HIG34299.1 hypothetical protein [Candidatus Poseidoniales archaeon]HIL67777.1 hypothetical protein [Candidatus Poseidoniales archaeon]